MLDLARKHDAALVRRRRPDNRGEAAQPHVDGHAGGELHIYDKRHLFTLAGNTTYRPGVERVEVTWRGWRILFKVCYDLRFPAFVRNNGTPYDLALYGELARPRRSLAHIASSTRHRKPMLCGRRHRSGTDANGTATLETA